MAVLIDPPRWPAHGTLFSHLVSDTSLEELHDIAERGGVFLGAFDHDHYDVPERCYADLVRLGAVEVAPAELVRRLGRSGLRIRTPDRTPKRAAVLGGLQASWSAVLPAHERLGSELLQRWSEPHRHYHDVRHLAFVVEVLAELRAPRVVVLAAWFHDAVYAGVPGQDEDASARLAELRLGSAGLPTDEVAEVARLVRLTAGHDPCPDDLLGAMLTDADLAVLGLSPGRYDVYVRDVRLDYREVPDVEWRVGRTAVLDRLLALDPLYRTPWGSHRWESQARKNLARERRRWNP